MAQSNNNSGYTQGHSKFTVATQVTRTAEADAGFLVPHIKKTDNILDIGCGPGTITTGFAKYASEGAIVGVDISEQVLQKAKALAAEANVPIKGLGSVVFEQGDVLKGLPYADESFDIIYCSQLFGHLPPPDVPLKALTEMRRILKPGGILATRDSAEQHFYPRSLDLDTLWVGNMRRVISHKDVPDVDPTATRMPALLRSAGFDADAGKVRVGGGATVFSTPESRKWLCARAVGQLQEGDPFRQSWLDAGITEEVIQQTLLAAAKWADTEDAWYVALHCDMLAWK
jgi:ubiquinone/menaquinone biosynthesis C-methylase UbiE